MTRLSPSRLNHLVRRKLASTQGFMLAEQILSIIFIGLLCIAVGAGIGAAVAAFGNVTKVTESQALLNRTVQEVSDELAYARDVDTAQSNPSFVSNSVHARVSFVNILGDTGNDSPGIGLSGKDIAAGTTSSGAPGTPSGGQQGSADQVLLIPAVGNFVPQIDGLSYSQGVWSFKINVYDSREGNGADSSQEPLATTTMNVARIGN